MQKPLPRIPKAKSNGPCAMDTQQLGDFLCFRCLDRIVLVLENEGHEGIASDDDDDDDDDDHTFEFDETFNGPGLSKSRWGGCYPSYSGLCKSVSGSQRP